MAPTCDGKWPQIRCISDTSLACKFIQISKVKEGDLIRTYTAIPLNPIRPVEGDSHPLGALPMGTTVCMVGKSFDRSRSFRRSRNPVLGAIPCWAQSHVGRNPRLGALPWGAPGAGPVQMQTGESHTLRCEVRGNPVPSLQWLQQTAGGEVLVRGYEPELRLDAASYQHQGSFVCSARNSIGEVQSDPLDVTILGRPEIDNLKVKTEYIVNLGEDVAMPVEFCSKPVPRVTWNLGSAGQAGRTVELIAGSTFERFHAASNRVVAKDCFTTTLVITGTELMDSKDFELRVENEYGVETVKLRVIVVDTRLFTEEVFAAIIVGGVLTILLITIIIIYMVRIGCCCMGSSTDKKQPDLAGSDKTDLESCRSSVSNQSQHGNLPNTVLPPDALYGTVSKKKYYEPEFNNSKEKLRPDLIRSETNSPYSTDAGMYGTLRPIDINQLYATSKKKKKPQPQQHPEYKSQGVDCQITSSYTSNSSLDDILKAYSGRTNSHYRDNRI